MELVIILSRILIIGAIPLLILKIEANDSFPVDQQQFQQQQIRLIQLFQLQCYRSPGKFRPITINQLMALFNQCARPHLISADFISKDVYPLRFDQMVQQCLQYKLNPEWNICQPFVLESMLYCLAEQDLSMVLRVQLMFRLHREQAYRLAHLIMNDCTDLLENVWQQQQPESSSKANNETSLERNIDLPQHKMATTI